MPASGVCATNSVTRRLDRLTVHIRQRQRRRIDAAAQGRRGGIDDRRLTEDVQDGDRRVVPARERRGVVATRSANSGTDRLDTGCGRWQPWPTSTRRGKPRAARLDGLAVGISSPGPDLSRSVVGNSAAEPRADRLNLLGAGLPLLDDERRQRADAAVVGLRRPTAPPGSRTATAPASRCSARSHDGCRRTAGAGCWHCRRRPWTACGRRRC